MSHSLSALTSSLPGLCVASMQQPEKETHCKPTSLGCPLMDAEPRCLTKAWQSSASTWQAQEGLKVTGQEIGHAASHRYPHTDRYGGGCV